MMALAYGLKEYGLSFYQIIFVTPTHKAKRVIQEKLDYFGLRVQTTTIHSLLGIKALHNGKELSFQPLTTRSFDIRDYKLVICDEGSMVESELHEYMQDALVRSPSTRVLWVGDDCQALPVGEAKIASTLRLPDRYQLSQVVRYGGAIGEIAKSLRDAIDSPELPTFRTNCSEDKTEGFLRLKKADWEKRILEEFLRPEYKKNSNHIRAIAYTNNRVQQLNDMIRSALYPNAPEFIVGERLIAQEGIIFNKYDDSGAIQNSDELIVTAITEGEMEGFECWYLSLTGDSGDYGGVPVLKAHKVTAHKERLNELASQKLWQKFWYLKTECFANLRYAYALTAHKSQGSTYRIAAVDMTNLSMMPRDKKTGKFLRTHRERNSLIYTAITRASHLVIAH
jgi:exodeoxyribonuclease-5